MDITRLNALETKGFYIDTLNKKASKVDPNTIAVEKEHNKDLFKKLKFLLGELETKRRFLQGLLETPPLSVPRDILVESEEKNAELKANLRLSKVEADALREDMTNKMESVLAERTRIVQERQEMERLMRDIADMERTLSTVTTHLQDQQSELTASEARETLKSQTRQLQDLYARMEHEQSLVEELKSQVAREEEHERKLEQQLKRANDQAAEAVRRLHLVDPEMEQEYRKLLVERQVFGVLTCIGNVTTGGGVLEITFTIAPDCTVKMKVLVHPETGKLLDADLDDCPCDISDAVAFACQRNDLAWLIDEANVLLIDYHQQRTN